jgi:glycosyltransferase involved in cell wall biosynthesis
MSSCAPPLVAVVTPVYNGEAYLTATMQSVQNQTYSNIVHVILDNCSTDRTAAIIEQFSNRRIKVISGRNPELIPMHANWNAALRLVPKETAYVKILCADDLIRHDCIARLVALAESDERIEVVLSHDVFDGNVRRANLLPKHTVFEGLAVARSSMNESINWLPYHHLFVRLHDNDVGAPIFEAREIGFDYVAVFDRLCRGRLGYIHEPLVYSRWHRDSETSKQIRAQASIILLTRLDILATHGRQCWDEPTYRKELERMRLRVARFVLRRKLAGEHAGVKIVVKSLEDKGVPLRPIDYIKSVFSAPAYARWKWSWHQLDGPKIDEANFLAEGRDFDGSGAPSALVRRRETGNGG